MLFNLSKEVSNGILAIHKITFQRKENWKYKLLKNAKMIVSHKETKDV